MKQPGDVAAITSTDRNQLSAIRVAGIRTKGKVHLYDSNGF